MQRWQSLAFPSISLSTASVCGDPVGVSSGEDGGVLIRLESVIIDHRTEVRRLGVGHDPTWITYSGKAHAHEVVHPHSFGTSDLRYAIGRRSNRRTGHSGGHVVGSDGAKQRVWQTDNVAVR